MQSLFHMKRALGVATAVRLVRKLHAGLDFSSRWPSLQPKARIHEHMHAIALALALELYSWPLS